MAKYELKTKKNKASVSAFINAVEDEQKRKDSEKIVEMMQTITGQPPVMWGSSIIGFGSYHYKGKSSEGDWMAVGFSPRKQNLTLYLMSGFKDMDAQLKKLGKHSTGKGCLYIKRLADVDEAVLRAMIKDSYTYVMSKMDRK